MKRRLRHGCSMRLGVRTSFLFAIICTVSIVAPSVFGQEINSKNLEGALLVQSKIIRPSGPIVKKEWISPVTSEAIRIEYYGITSGQIVVDNARLFLMPNQCWVLVMEDGNTENLSCLFDQFARKITFKTNRSQRWAVDAVNVHEIPLRQPGIATETEPSIDLTIDRM